MSHSDNVLKEACENVGYVYFIEKMKNENRQMASLGCNYMLYEYKQEWVDKTATGTNKIINCI